MGHIHYSGDQNGMNGSGDRGRGRRSSAPVFFPSVQSLPETRLRAGRRGLTPRHPATDSVSRRTAVFFAAFLAATGVGDKDMQRESPRYGGSGEGGAGFTSCATSTYVVVGWEGDRQFSSMDAATSDTRLTAGVGRRPGWFVLAFPGACALGSACGFLQGAWSFGVVEAVWSLVALRRWSLTE
jgi:hypothetical protein